MSRVYFISDIHFGHKSISNKYRTQFNSSEEHDEIILNNIITTLKKRDTLWILGDCFFTAERYDYFFSKVKCQSVNWVIGNHDTDDSERQENVKRFCRETNPIFGKVGSLFKYHGYWLSHPPIHPTELRGCRNIHGHTHDVVMTLEDGTVDDRYINVCCEHVNYAPIDFMDIKKDRND